MPDADDSFALPSGSLTERVCQTCAHCTWIGMNACRNPKALGFDGDMALEHGVHIISAYRVCRGEHWQEQEFDE